MNTEDATATTAVSESQRLVALIALGVVAVALLYVLPMIIGGIG